MIVRVIAWAWEFGTLVVFALIVLGLLLKLSGAGDSAVDIGPWWTSH